MGVSKVKRIGLTVEFKCRIADRTCHLSVTDCMTHQQVRSSKVTDTVDMTFLVSQKRRDRNTSRNRTVSIHRTTNSVCLFVVVVVMSAPRQDRSCITKFVLASAFHMNMYTVRHDIQPSLQFQDMPVFWSVRGAFQI